ncbi:hypothetical protein IAT38_004718 [Cryptococcus sp. DSM 104549]
MARVVFLDGNGSSSSTASPPSPAASSPFFSSLPPRDTPPVAFAAVAGSPSVKPTYTLLALRLMIASSPKRPTSGLDGAIFGMCWAGSGAGAWSGTILKSLGFTSVKANLLLVPGPVFDGLSSVALAHFGDKYDRRGIFILFTAIWTLAGLIALYKLPILSGGSWGFYAAMVVTAASPSWQAFNVTWVALNARTPAERSITYAVYIGCSNLGSVYGNQVFRASDAPLYRRAWAAILALGAIWSAVTLAQILQYQWSNRIKEREWSKLSKEEQEAYVKESSKDPIHKRLDARYAL